MELIIVIIIVFFFILLKLDLALVFKILFSQRQAKIIIIDGAIGVGKSTLIAYLSDFLKNKGYKVYYEEEIILQDNFLKDFLYSDINNGSIEKYSFHMQHQLILMYRLIYEKIKSIQQNYDFIILDRSHESTKIFAMLNIKDQKELKYLNEQIDKIDNFKYDFVFYVYSSINNMLIRQKKRQRKEEEEINQDYLIKIYNLFEENYKKLYPKKCFEISTDFKIEEYNEKILDNIFKIIK